MNQKKLPPQTQVGLSLFERLLFKLAETTVIYVLFGLVLFYGTSTLLLGHIPNRAETMERIQQIKDFMARSNDLVSGIERTNTQLQALGPQLNGVSENIEKMGQRISDLEKEVLRLKARQH